MSLDWAMTPRRDDTKAHRAMLRRIAAHGSKLQRAEREVERLRAARVDLYLSGRLLDPPLSYRRMAEAQGLTEAAVMQVMRRIRQP